MLFGQAEEKHVLRLVARIKLLLLGPLKNWEGKKHGNRPYIPWMVLTQNHAKYNDRWLLKVMNHLATKCWSRGKRRAVNHQCNAQGQLTCDIHCINRYIYAVEVSRYNFVRAKGKGLGTWLNINEIRNNRKNISIKKIKQSTYLNTKKKKNLRKKGKKKGKKKEEKWHQRGSNLELLNRSPRTQWTKNRFIEN